MATTQSTEVTDIKVNTSLVIKESNDGSLNANNTIYASGLFMNPSNSVPGRPNDITGFIVTASNELGKLEFSDSVGFISLNDLSDVNITNIQDEDFLKYDAATQEWINTSLALTFVTVNGIQTLTNKTMTDNSNNLTARGLFSDTGGNTVSVFSSPNPTNGQVLTATNATTATWQDPAGDVTLNGVQTLTNKTITDNTNNVTARGLFTGSGTGTVSTFAATAPLVGQVITATGGSTATWQTPAGGDVTLNGIQTLTNKTMTDNTNDVTSRSLFSNSGGNTISVFAAANPTSGQVLTATSGTTATWQTPAGGDVTLNGVQTLTNKTMTSSTNNLTSRGLFSDSGGNTISVFASANPTSGQVLTATGASTATWQDTAGDVTLNGVQTLTNKTMTDNSNNLISRELFVDTGAGSVSTYASAVPSTGQVLTATSGTTATWQDTGDVTLNGVQTLTNKTITDNSNNVTSRGLFTGSGTGTVSTFAATAPSGGQILTATSGTTATWQAPQVTLTGLETLTNKTMTSNTNDIISRELFVDSGSGSVSTFAAAVPSNGQILTATGATTATWQTPQVTLNGLEAFSNKTMTSNTNNVTARSLFTGSGSGSVSVFAATAPSLGQVLTATGASTATWQTLAGGDVTLNGVQTLTDKTITDNSNDVTSRGMFTGSGTGTLSTYAATAPSSGQILTATSGTTATWQAPQVTLTGLETLTNKTMTSNTNDIISRELFVDSGSGSVSTFAAAVPSSGQILTATGATTATWQTPQVTLTGSETLTNKTMTSSTNNVTSRGLFTDTGSGTVSTFAAAAPSSGQILTATGATTATWQTPQVTLTGSQTLTNKTITDNSNNLISRELFVDSGSGSVSTFAAAVPSSGQVLTATGATTATWQTPSAAAGGSTTEVQFNNAGSLDGISGITTNGSTQLNFADNSLAQFGTGNDLTITHNATNSLITSNTGDLIIENDNVTGSTIHRLGTATNATDFQIQDSANTTLFSVDGLGQTLIGGSDETFKFMVEDSSNVTALVVSSSSLTTSVVNFTATGSAFLSDTTTILGTNDTEKFKITNNSGVTEFNVDTTTAETTATSFIATSIIGDRVIYIDEKAQNTQGGSFNSGAWQIRDLNTERYSRETTGWVGLSLSNISLVAGTYYINGSAPGYRVTRHKTRFYNVNDGTTAIVGTSEYAGSSSTLQTRSFIEGVVTIASAKTFRFEHRCEVSQATFGFGVASNFNFEPEVYATIRIDRLA